MASGDAERVALALGGRPQGAGWVCFCPAHANTDAPALWLSEGYGGRLVAECRSGCDATAVLRALAERGLIGEGYASGDYGQLHPSALAGKRRRQGRDRERQRIQGFNLWRFAFSAEHSPVAAYLRERRSLAIPFGAIPDVLRYRAQTWCSIAEAMRPAMVALVTDPERRTTAWKAKALGAFVQFLDARSRGGFASRMQVTRGPIHGGAVQLSAPDHRIALAVGIESALAFWCATGIPTWATLSISNLAEVHLPARPLAGEVIGAPDRDFAALAAANRLRKRCEIEGRLFRLAMPHKGFTFADCPTGAIQCDAPWPAWWSA